MFRGMISKVCRAAIRCERIEQAGTGTEGLALCREMRPDVVLLDLDLPDIYGLDLVGRIREVVPHAKTIVLSAHTEDYVIHRSLKLEVDGFVDKNDEPEEAIVRAIESVTANRPYFSSAVGKIKALIRDDPKAFAKLLSDREQELLECFGRGLSDDQIAEKTGISPATVIKHHRNIMAKLGFHTAVELRRYALEKGFAPPPRERAGFLGERR